MTIFTVACTFAIAAGMHPFIPGFIALVTVNVYNASYNNGTYITAMAAADGIVRCGSTSKMSWVYTLACIVGCHLLRAHVEGLRAECESVCPGDNGPSHRAVIVCGRWSRKCPISYSSPHPYKIKMSQGEM